MQGIFQEVILPDSFRSYLQKPFSSPSSWRRPLGVKWKLVWQDSASAWRKLIGLGDSLAKHSQTPATYAWEDWVRDTIRLEWDTVGFQLERVAVQEPTLFLTISPEILLTWPWPVQAYGGRSLPLQSPVYTLRADGVGRLWIGTADGNLLCWDGHLWRQWGPTHGPPFASIASIAWEPKNLRLWLGTLQGLWLYDGIRWFRAHIAEEKGSILPYHLRLTEEGDLLIGIYRPEKNQRVTYVYRQGRLYRIKPKQGKISLPLSESQRPWLLWQLPKQKKQAVAFLRDSLLMLLSGCDSLGRLSVRYLQEDSRGRLWINAMGKLYRWEEGRLSLASGPSLSRLAEITPSQALWLSENNTLYLLSDTTWLSLPPLKPLLLTLEPYAGGWALAGANQYLLYLKPGPFHYLPLFGTIETAPSYGIGILDSVLYLGQANGRLFRVRGDRIEQVQLSAQAELRINSVYAVAQLGDSALGITYDGAGPTFIEVGRSGTLTELFVPGQSYPAYAVFRDKRGHDWFLHQRLWVDSLPVRIDTAELVPLMAPFGGPSGRVWVITAGQLHCWTGEKWLRAPLALPGEVRVGAEGPTGQLVFGTTNQGLFLQIDSARYLHLTPEQGLPDAYITQLAWQGDTLIVGTSKGITFLNRSGEILAVYRRQGGLREYEDCNGGYLSPLAYIGEKELLGCRQRYFTAIGSEVASFSVVQAAHPPTPPLPLLAHITLSRRDIFPYLDSLGLLQRASFDTPYPLPERVSLPYEKNYLGFIPSAQGSSGYTEGLRFRYRLEGYDKEWTYLSQLERIEYPNLPAGTYTLALQARWLSSSWSSPFRFSFTVRPPWWQHPLAWGLYALVGAAGVWGLLRWRTAQLRRRALWLAKEVAKATQTIREQNAELERKNQEIAQKNKDLTDSITYAKRIQQALFPPPEALQSFFSDSFVLLLPRDIVSGDMYWFYRPLSAQAYAEEFYLLVGDCTGHGVPGAFVSLLSLALLQRSVVEYGLEAPNEILDTVSLQLNALLNPDGGVTVRDGFEGVLLRFSQNGDKTTLTYASAHRPFWRVLPDQTIWEAERDLRSVGPSDRIDADAKSFSLYTLTLQKGEWLYFSTDGFSDQLGGEKGRRMGTKAFRQLLVEASHLRGAEQVQFFQERFHAWRGAYPQVDDVLLVGVRI